MTTFYQNKIYQAIYDILAPLLGTMTGRKAIELACKRCGTNPDQLSIKELAEVLVGLRPMLRTLLGIHTADKVLKDIRNKALEKDLS